MLRRDRRVDTLRGILLVIMTVDHLGGALTRLTGETLGFVTAAPGFVLLSAYLSAYTSRSASAWTDLWSAAHQRALRIYWYHVAALTFVFALAALSPVYFGYWADRLLLRDQNLLHAFIDSLFLLHQPMYFDILPMYCIFSLVSPLVLMSLSRGYGERALMLSALLWFVALWFDPHNLLTTALGNGDRPSVFNILSWQLLWVIGLYIGWMHGRGHPLALHRQKIIVLGAAVVVMVFFAARHDILPFPQDAINLLSNSRLGPLRLLNIGAVLVVFLLAIKFMEKHAGLPWFDFVGRYSLQIFTYHILAVYLLLPLTWRVARHWGGVGEVAYALAVAASLTIPTILYEQYRTVVGRRKSQHSDKSAAATLKKR